MKRTLILAVLAVVMIVSVIGCASGPDRLPTRVEERDNKGNAIGVPTPEWIKLYVGSGISALQAQPQYKDMYCIVGEETGVNLQFVLAWADNFSAQQRIGAMLRTNIVSAYQAKVDAAASSSGGANTAVEASGSYNQQIDNVINAVVNVAYSGAQRENDWWVLRRTYDPDQEGVYNDAYTAYVLYTIPKSQLDQQISSALQRAVDSDSELYTYTLQVAQDILSGGVTDWIANTPVDAE